MRKTLIFLELMLCVVLMGGLSWAFLSRTPTRAFTGLVHYDPPTPEAVDLALHRAGITPETLAAAGASAAQTTAIVNEAETILNATPGLLISKDTALFEDKNEMDRLVRLVRSGQATQQEITDCQQAKTDHAASLTSLDTTLDTFFDDLTDQLPALISGKLSTTRDNARWDLPIEFKVITRNESEWLHLRRALANERIAAKDADEEPDSGEQTFLSTMRANPIVALAKVSLDANLSSIETAWEQALDE